MKAYVNQKEENMDLLKFYIFISIPGIDSRK